MRPDLTTIVKHLAAYRAYKGGQSVCSIAQQAGVGVGTIYRWIRIVRGH
jgi:transposase